MDDRTGEIRQFESDEEAIKAGFNVLLDSPPNPTCRRCDGKGSRRKAMSPGDMSRADAASVVESGLKGRSADGEDA